MYTTSSHTGRNLSMRVRSYLLRSEGLRQISILLAAGIQIFTSYMKHYPIDDLYNELIGEYPQ